MINKKASKRKSGKASERKYCKAYGTAKEIARNIDGKVDFMESGWSFVFSNDHTVMVTEFGGRVKVTYLKGTPVDAK